MKSGDWQKQILNTRLDRVSHKILLGLNNNWITRCWPVTHVDVMHVDLAYRSPRASRLPLSPGGVIPLRVRAQAPCSQRRAIAIIRMKGKWTAFSQVLKGGADKGHRFVPSGENVCHEAAALKRRLEL